MRQLSLPLDGPLDDAKRRRAEDGQTVIVHLASESIEALALRLAELMGDSARAERWIDANEVARRHGVSRAFVYEHADELGAIRVGAGPRPRLRFDPAAVGERLAAAVAPGGPKSRPPGTPAATAPRHPAGASNSRGGLLPIRGASQPSSAAKRRRRTASKSRVSRGRNAA
jgi:hypothetical protein